MSYNIQHGANSAGVLNLEKIAEVLQQANVDIIGLQEVDRAFDERSNFVLQAKELASALGYHYCYGENLLVNDGEGAYGTAILSKYPIIRSENIHLSSFDDEQRGVLIAKIQMDEQVVSFYNTHLGLALEDRLIQVKEIGALLQDEINPYLLVGDFNTIDTNADYEWLMKHGKLQDPFYGQSGADTFPADHPTERIDYILLSQGITYDKQEVIHVETSDHVPIVVEVTI